MVPFLLNGGVSIKWFGEQKGMGFQKYGVELADPDLVTFAMAVGAVGHRVQFADELCPTLHHCITTPAVHVVEVPIDHSISDKLQVIAPSITSTTIMWKVQRSVT